MYNRRLKTEINEIRLLLLHPGGASDKLICSLLYASLNDSTLKYEVVSYTWGEPQPAEIIELEGLPFSIRPNLGSFLYQVRGEDSARLIWVDAVCINQDDDDERSSQVRIMTRIYEQASYVRVWLGPEAQGSSLAMSLIRELTETSDDSFESNEAAWNVQEDAARILYDYYLALEGPEELDQKIAAAYKKDGSNKQWIAFYDLLDRPYWTRVWVFQELICAKRIVVTCGASWVDWRELVLVLRNAAESDEEELRGFGLLRNGSPLVVQQLRGARGVSKLENPPSGIEKVKFNGHVKLSRLLISQRERECTVPKDRVYAMLGIASETSSGAFPVDYHMDVYETYRSLFQFLATEHGDLDSLSASGIGSSDSKRPSWVPDWNEAPSTTSLHIILANVGLSACRSLAFMGDFSYDGRILNADGIGIDTVHKLSDSLNPSESSFSYIKREAVLDMARMIMDLHPRSGPELNREDAYRLIGLARALSADRPPGRRRKVSGEAIALPMCIILGLKNHDPDVSDADHENIRATIEELMFGFSLATTNRRFCISKKGHHGLVPLDTRQHDILCIITGCSTPMVLRPVEEHYVVIGEAYVQGFMAGEALNEAIENKTKPQVFEIH